MKHAFIVPLIGGQLLGQEAAIGIPPEFILSYTPFSNNDQHVVNWYKQKNMDIPYYLLDKEVPKNLPEVDVIGTTCPCAGLSQLSGHHSPDAAANEWMYKTAEYILGELKPKVLWGENAPLLAGPVGTPVRERLFEIGRRNGYTMTIYKTKSLLHGVPQIRERSFYFFWKGNRPGVLSFIKKPHTRIEDLLKGIKSNFQQESKNKDVPSSDPYYQFVLKEIHPNKTHAQFQKAMETDRSADIMMYIEDKGISYLEVSKWMASNGYESQVEKCIRKHEKLTNGGSIMRRGVYVPRNYINAFVGHMPVMCTHHEEDRFLTYREGMSIMGLPESFELINPKKNTNHMCQNVPVGTATDMAREIIKWINGSLDVSNSDYVSQNNLSGKIEEGSISGASLSHFFA